MLNHSEGEEVRVEGRRCIRSTGNGETHLVFGPYVSLAAGRYVADFWLAGTAGLDAAAAYLCAILDVAVDDGRAIIAHEFIFADQLAERLQRFQLAFELTRPSDRVEFRVRANATVPIVAADDVTAHEVEASTPRPVSLAPDCPLVRDNPEEIVNVFRRGYRCRRGDDGLRFEKDGIVVAADERDDLNFLGEVFEARAYNIIAGADQCVIDIGMNVGLTTLMFASRPNVREVHSFEPFASTFRKAERNLALNRGIAGKVRAHHVGLSDHDGDETILVPDTSDSGSRATLSVEGGRPVTLTLRDAATCLAPIIDAARAKRRQVIAKVDCEGSEFVIFESLIRAGLLSRIDAYLVEWHAMFADKTARDLIDPLVDAGFMVIDLSPPSGNGFFYAINGRRHERRGWRTVRRLLERR